ncbi:peptidase S8/S53 domain-containing protein [Colletotrichum phormii]|uniref:Peptidase S8/S53 domain-containing protein n=1 Tax=Colletotrichum phormii TaxID=359342 RepID=A0AAI9ZFZ3_9PEZI|nr:peptidase S8/S53 domain-containing protein [Colletotrichum phormii]KAK1623533.1 peptidase S8/S53 domain-containing protein [Colletotrichum phormii]
MYWKSSKPASYNFMRPRASQEPLKPRGQSARLLPVGRRQYPETKDIGRRSTVQANIDSASTASKAELLQASHEDTGVLRLHEENVTGGNVRVAIMDAAIDVTAPGLRETNIAYTANLRTGANKSAGSCDPHGTGNLGIAGGKGDPLWGYTGVAPDAIFEAIAITDCVNAVNGDDQVNDFLQMQVTLVLYGSAPSRVDSLTVRLAAPWPALIERMFNNGTLVTTCAGNTGPVLYSIRAPTASRGGMPIGTYDTSLVPVYTWQGNWTAGGESGPLYYHPSDPTDVQTFDMPDQINLTLWWPGAFDPTALEGPQDVVSPCRPLPANAKPPSDPATTILLQSRYECWSDPDDTSLDITTKYGIPYVMGYAPNYAFLAFSIPRMGSTNLSPSVRAAVNIGLDEAARLVSLLAKHDRVDLSLAGDPSSAKMNLSFITNNQTGLTPSSWTTWGPALDTHMSVAVLGPSQYVAMPFPARLGGLGVWAGTSFSTPYLGGVAALVKSAHPEWSPRQIRNAIVATARPVNYNDGIPNFKVRDLKAPVQQQGGGMVDAWSAVRSATVVNVTDLAFNDTDNRPPFLSFTLKNTGVEELSYQLDHVPAGSGYVIDPAAPYTFSLRNISDAYASISISPTTLTLKGGESASVAVSIRSESELADAASRLSFFGGYIETGYGGPLLNLPIIDRRQTSLIGVRLPDFALIDIEPGRVFNATYDGSVGIDENPITYPDGIYPAFAFQQVVRSRLVSYSMVNTKTGEAPFHNDTVSTDAEPMSAAWFWGGSEDNRTFVPAGTYVWEILALRMNGDRENPTHFEFWRSDEWSLVYSLNSTGLPTI